ncbi:YtxH domain-containing protein [Paenibacillus timonensis]|uniref:YtxH domain-containing protein n=1 Tax=Paenibacillus timonensis TaxID=225915 RepID=UPI003F99187C
MSKGNKGWLWGAAIGTVAGAVTALLFAPKAGKELRKDIADGARQVGEKTQEVAGKVSEQSTVLVGKVKEAAGGLISEIQSRLPAKDAEEENMAQVSEFAADEESVVEEETVVLGVVAGEETTEADVLEVAASEAAATSESEEDK